MDYATEDVTATEGADYVRTSGTLVFSPGEISKTVVVPVLDDTYDEAEETFILRLSNPTGARVADPPGGTGTGTIVDDFLLSVTDGQAREEEGSLTFDVTLDRPADWEDWGTVTVDYATVDGTARAGEDYVRASGTLAFSPGETLKTISVPVLMDGVDDSGETFTLRLSNARLNGSPTGVRILNSEATGTILNDDPMPKAWLAHFGRAVAAQVVDAVGARLEGTPRPHVTVGGVPLGSPTHGTAPAPGRGESEPGWTAWTDAPEEAQSLTERELLLGSSFHLASQSGGKPTLTAWGRVATGGFDAPVDDAGRTDGRVTTGFLGADVAGERWLAGVMLSHSEGDGGYAFGSETALAHGQAAIESTMTGVYPYAQTRVSDRVSLWGLAGVGQGRLTLAEAGGAPIETDLDLTLGALGARGTLLSPAETGGFELALRSDAFWTRLTSDAVHSETTGNLAGSETDGSRLRFAVEGARSFSLGAHDTLTPTFALGVRHDRGDAENGLGLEIGAGVRYAGVGIAVEGAVRTLVAHEEDGYEAWEASGSLRIDPASSGRGLSLTLTPTFGTAPSDVGGPWRTGDPRGLATGTVLGEGRRLDAEVGYGVGLSRNRGVVIPYTGASFRDGGAQAWRLGARWRVAPELALGLEGTRHDGGDGTPEHAVTLRGTLLH